MIHHLAIGAVLATAACGRSDARVHADSHSPSPSLSLPLVATPPAVDGELTEPSWRDAARTGAFRTPAGDEARPYSDARLMWDATNLYIGLYAADDDIEVHGAVHDGPLWMFDAFEVRLQPNGEPAIYVLDLGPSGALSDARVVADVADPSWESGARIAVDSDGTPDLPADEDEEWVVEVAVPWSSLRVDARAGARVSIGIHRCDTPKRGPRGCGAWGEGPRHAPTATLVLDERRP